MSIAIMSRLFKLTLGSCERKLLAIRLADFADDDGRGIYPGVARLARETDLSERTVQRKLKEFVDEGILIVKAEASGRPGQATRYDFDLAALDRLASGASAKPRGDSVSPVISAETGADRGDCGTETGDTDDREGCPPVTRTVIEPSIKPSSERGRVSELAEGESRQAIERGFLRWWPTWPTYPSGSESTTRKAWFSLSAEERAECIDRTPDFIKAVGERKKDYTYAHVYLADRAWRRLAAKMTELPKAEPVRPLGKAGMATRFAELCKPMNTAWLAPSPFVKRILDEGGEAAERELMGRRERYGWAKVGELNEAIKTGQSIVAKPEMVEAGADFISIELAGPVGDAWKRFHARMKFPYLPVTEAKYAYFPPIAAGANDLDEAVAAAFWAFKERIEGHVHAAAE